MRWLSRPTSARSYFLDKKHFKQGKKQLLKKQVQVLNYVVDDAAKRKSEADYTVIMIITDGGISDMAETKAALVALSRKPVSVVLVRRKVQVNTSYKKVQVNTP